MKDVLLACLTTLVFVVVTQPPMRDEGDRYRRPCGGLAQAVDADMRRDEMGASHPTRVHCWELACRDQKGIRSTIPLEFRQLKQRRERWWEWLRQIF
jgi:hypothetical protein